MVDALTDHYQYYVHAHQIIPYCLRLSEETLDITDFNNTIDSNYTFTELKVRNITSQMLLSWSAPIEIAENYQSFLDNISYVSSENETLFYNCTSSWFGSFCRFSFDKDFNMYSLTEIINYYLFFKLKITESAVVTCYKHLNCQTNLRCLDWRNICDRKIDCLDKSDELNCWQLEINECAENEYRCHNGQCIPVEFFQDIPLNPDCLDKTDEPVVSISVIRCPNDPTFRCEEQTCRPGTNEFSCDDGTCIAEMTFECLNGRDNLCLMIIVQER
jgi:hypothetical protein